MLKDTWQLNKEWESDWKFYLSMCEPAQVGRIAGVDMKLTGKENEKQNEQGREAKRKTKSDSQKRKLSHKVSGEEFENGSEQEQPDKDDEVTFNQKRKKARTQKIILEIDPSKLITQTADTTDRLGMSVRQTAMVMASVVKAGGGQVSKVKLSKSAVHRQRKKARCAKGKLLKESFEPAEDGFVLHYDTKLVDPKGRDREDRAAVLYSGGPHKQPYLLGIPRFESSSGKDVETGVLKELEKYDINLEKCVGTCYDTTSSNSGLKKGAHFRIEKDVGHAILELECRKHVQELHVTHANKAVFGATKAPQKLHYKEFKNAWSFLNLDPSTLVMFDREKYANNTFFLEKAVESLQWAENHLEKKTFPRDDYRELNELIVVYLGGQVPGGFRPKRKGAMHEARFMADAIFTLSVELFSNVHKVDIKLSEQIHKMAIFIALWHWPNFLRCALAPTAASNDLKYFYDMKTLVNMDDPDFSRI